MARETDADAASCERVRELLALGEPVVAPELEAHLRECVACREAAAWLGRLEAALIATAATEPPAELDRRVREALAAGPARSRLALRPGLAAALAVASLFALIVALATASAQAGAADMGPAIAIVGVWIYLGLSFAATLPLLVGTRGRRWARRGEVRS